MVGQAPISVVVRKGKDVYEQGMPLAEREHRGSNAGRRRQSAKRKSKTVNGFEKKGGEAYGKGIGRKVLSGQKGSGPHAAKARRGPYT